MSQENVDIVRAGIQAWNAGDMDALGDLLHADAVSGGLDDWPQAGPSVGREALMRQCAQMRESVDSDSVDVDAVLLDIGDRVAVRVSWRESGRGPKSDMELTGVFIVRGGLIHSVDFFWDHTEALEAAALRK